MDITDIQKDFENGIDDKEKVKFGTADFLIELENKRAIKVSSPFVMCFLFHLHCNYEDGSQNFLKLGI